jgi:hypothetical protein
MEQFVHFPCREKKQNKIDISQVWQFILDRYHQGGKHSFAVLHLFPKLEENFKGSIPPEQSQLFHNIDLEFSRFDPSCAIPEPVLSLILDYNRNLVTQGFDVSWVIDHYKLHLLDYDSSCKGMLVKFLFDVNTQFQFDESIIDEIAKTICADCAEVIGPISPYSDHYRCSQFFVSEFCRHQEAAVLYGMLPALCAWYAWNGKGDVLV